VEERTTDLSRLHQVSLRMVQAENFRVLLDEILEAAIEITRADKGNIQLFEGGALKIVNQRGFEAPFLNFFKAVHHGHGAACGTAMERGGRVNVEDVTKSPIFIGTPALNVLLEAGVRAVQSTPLLNRAGKVLGMFSTHYAAPHRLTDREIGLLD